MNTFKLLAYSEAEDAAHLWELHEAAREEELEEAKRKEEAKLIAEPQTIQDLPPCLPPVEQSELSISSSFEMRTKRSRRHRMRLSTYHSRRSTHVKDDGADAYFWMYEYKIKLCTKHAQSQPTSVCKYLHRLEKSIRRDPRRFYFSNQACPDYRRDESCPNGDKCNFTHGVLEWGLHPLRFRTKLCEQVNNCKRTVCFYAHTQSQLRVLPKWEELNEDCLVQVFEKVGLESLIRGVSLVCKSWYRASLSPDWYKCLDFKFLSRRDVKLQKRNYGNILAFEETKRNSNDEIIKFVLNRSCGMATHVWLPRYFSSKALIHVSERCPSLRFLMIPSSYCLNEEYGSHIPKLIPKWKKLEVLSLGRTRRYFKEILTEVNTYCKSFTSLILKNARFYHHEAKILVQVMPNIKRLTLLSSRIIYMGLETLLEGCRELEFLEVRNCTSHQSDEEILSMASNVETVIAVGNHYYCWSSDVFDNNDCRFLGGSDLEESSDPQESSF